MPLSDSPVSWTFSWKIINAREVIVCFSSSVGRAADFFQNCPPQKQLLSDCACVKHSRRKHALFGVRHLCRRLQTCSFSLAPCRAEAALFSFSLLCANGELIDQTLWYFYIVNLAIIFCRKGVKIHRRGVDDRLLSASFLPPRNLRSSELLVRERAAAKQSLSFSFFLYDHFWNEFL